MIHKKQNQDALESLNEVYESAKQHFDAGFHGVLWWLYDGNGTAGKLCCFTFNFGGGGAQLVIAHANEAGCQPTHCYFKSGIKHDEIESILVDLNKKVFNLDEEVCDQIVLSSMVGQEKGDKVEETMYSAAEDNADHEADEVEHWENRGRRR